MGNFDHIVEKKIKEAIENNEFDNLEGFGKPLDNSEYFIVMDDSPKPPPNRMSMSRRLLLKAQVAVLLMLGEGKRQAYENFNDDSLDNRSCPAKLIEAINESYLVTDLE